jgi:ABC-type antimicrobial peptide transport system permease subunit
MASIAALTLGIAMNTIVFFSVFNSLALRPLPVPGAHRAVRLHPIDAALQHDLVRERLKEIGIQLARSRRRCPERRRETALGAAAHDVVALVLRDGWRLIRLGLLVGRAASVVAAPLLGQLLFGVSVFDPATLCGVPLLLTAIAFGACYLPARRASKREPIAVLRMD